MTLIEDTVERLAAGLLNTAITAVEQLPTVEPAPETVELVKLVRIASGEYNLIPNGSISRVPTKVSKNPTRIVDPIAEGEEMAAFSAAARGESDVPTHALQTALVAFANRRRPSVAECIVLSRTLSVIATGRKGIVMTLRDF